MEESRVRLGSGLVRVTAALIGVPIVIWTLSPGKRAIVKKISWANRTGGAGWLAFGFLTLAPAFVQAFHDIAMTNAVHDNLVERDLPIFGNSVQGYVADTTAAPLGTLGNIVVQSTVGGAVGADVQIVIEVEEI